MSILNRPKNKIQADAEIAQAPKAAAAKPLDIKKVLAKEWSQTTPPERAALAKHFNGNAYPHSFEWNWKQINYNRMALVTYVTSRIPDCAYLEIGCDQNALFDAVSALDKTGVDPGRGGTIRKTSDDFFAVNTKKFDFVWVDGLHEYRQVHRDVANSIAALKPGGFIALHDMLPMNWKLEHMPRMNLGWTGDVWKVAFEIAATKGLDFKLVTIDHGCGIFQVNDPSAQLVDLNDTIADKKFGYLYENINKLPTATWDETKAWIDAALDQ
jgi:SAM-dependent methyltransferase